MMQPKSEWPESLAIRPDDPARVPSLTRTEYLAIREALLHPAAPSQCVKTTDLANVVRGRTDVQLPAWANDENFDSEFFRLVEENNVVLICSGCDRIVGFFNLRDPLAVSIVASRENFCCPYCNSPSLMTAASTSLTSGDPIVAPNIEVSTSEISELYRKISDDESVLPSERLLDDVISRRYFSAGEHVIKNSPILGSEREEAIGLLVGLGVDKSGLLELQSLDLRPIWQPEKKKGNLLGRLWYHHVKLAVSHDAQDLDQIAIGIAPVNGLGASVHLGEMAESAIVLEQGLFSRVYAFNQIIFALEVRQSQPEGLIDVLVSKLIQGRSAIDLGDYSSQDEYLFVDKISELQRLFVVLHEIAHRKKMLEIRDQRAKHGNQAQYSQSGIEEIYADKWAAERIARGDYADCDGLCRIAIFWYLEYLNVSLGRSEDLPWGPRRRWDSIESTMTTKNLKWGQFPKAKFRDMIDRRVATHRRSGDARP